MQKQAWAALVLTVGGLWGCAPRRIPGTNIEDTTDNEAILKVIGDYQTAYQRRDAKAILALVSPSFFETNGTPEADDDYDYAGLAAMLAEQFKQIDKPTLDLDIRKIEVKDGEAAVNYYFASHFQMANAGPNAGFKSTDGTAQIHLRREDGTWKIISGI